MLSPRPKRRVLGVLENKQVTFLLCVNGVVQNFLCCEFLSLGFKLFMNLFASLLHWIINLSVAFSSPIAFVFVGWCLEP